VIEAVEDVRSSLMEQMLGILARLNDLTTAYSAEDTTHLMKPLMIRTLVSRVWWRNFVRSAVFSSNQPEFYNARMEVLELKVVMND
jgi:hypothetical protein